MGQKLVVKNQDGSLTRITVFTQPNKQLQNLITSMKTGSKTESQPGVISIPTTAGSATAAGATAAGTTASPQTSASAPAVLDVSVKQDKQFQQPSTGVAKTSQRLATGDATIIEQLATGDAKSSEQLAKDDAKSSEQLATGGAKRLEHDLKTSDDHHECDVTSMRDKDTESPDSEEFSLLF